MDKETDDIVKQYTASLTSEERQEVGRELLAEEALDEEKLVGSRVLWWSRTLFVGVFIVYWSWSRFTFAALLLSLIPFLALPGAVVLSRTNYLRPRVE